MTKNVLICLLALIITALSHRSSAQMIVMDHEYYTRDYEKERKERFAEIEARIKKSPKDAALYFERGRLYESYVQLAEAEKDYSKAITLDPQYQKVYTTRAMVRERLSKRDEAAADYKSAYALKPEAGTMASLARIYISQGNNKGAEECYTKAIELTRKERGMPELSYLHARANIRWKNLGDHHGALGDYEELLEHNPHDAAIWVSKAHIKLEGLKDYTGAVDDFTETINRDPAGDAYFYRGKAKYMMNNTGGALDDILKAYERSYGSIPYMKEKAFFDELVASNKLNAKAYLARALFRSYGRAVSEAEADLDQALKLDPFYGEAWFFKGKYLLDDLKDVSKAIEYFTKAESCGYKAAEVYYHRGKARMYQSDSKNALIDADKAIKIDPLHGNAWKLRIDMKRALNDNEGADADQHMLNSLSSQYGHSRMYWPKYF